MTILFFFFSPKEIYLTKFRNIACLTFPEASENEQLTNAAQDAVYEDISETINPVL